MVWQVHEQVKEEFLATVTNVMREFYGDDPKDSKDFSRIISQGHVKRLAGYLDELRELEDESIRILNEKGGEVVESERYVAPTLVLFDGDWIKKGAPSLVPYGNHKQPPRSPKTTLFRIQGKGGH